MGELVDVYHGVFCIDESGRWLAPPAWQNQLGESARMIFDSCRSARYLGIRLVSYESPFVSDDRNWLVIPDSWQVLEEWFSDRAHKRGLA